jgi:8-oxo-dGTP pyrophosphatase MutT (NUDIX family)
VIDKPVQQRWPLEIDGDIVGSVTPEDAIWFNKHIEGLHLESDCLSVLPHCSPDAPAVLAQMANLLREHGRLGKWRNELLRVTGDSGQVRGMVERAAVRALGIRTFAVHLVAYADEQSHMWVQQRALDKATDPGMWDTCAGGLAAGDESLTLSMQREAYEEAGLKLDELAAQGCHAIRRRGCTVKKPLPEGFMVEELLVWDIDLPAKITPINLDGEVARFEKWPIATVLQKLQEGLFTNEATWITRQSLQERKITSI